MSTQEQTVTVESVPTQTQEQQTAEVVTTDPAAVQTQEATEPVQAESPKAVKELIQQRKRRQQAEQEAAYWKGRAEALAGGQETAPTQQTTPATPATPPTADKFETWEEYEAANQEYMVQQAALRLEQQFQARQIQQQQQQTQAQFKQRLAMAEEQDPAFHDILTDPTLPISPVMVPLLQITEAAPDIIRWLHNNRSEAARISALAPTQAALELGKLEAKLQYENTPTPVQTVSAAPEPIPTVAAAGNIDDSNLSTDEWIRRRNEARKYQ